MHKLEGKSKDIVADNIGKLKELFPEVFREDKVDFEILQRILGEYIEDKEERYRFEWNGKSKAIKLAQTPSTGTLRPCKEESKSWDTTENLYIEGDNLEVLKLLQKAYHNRIKMIYIDPPYNTGQDFVYPDNYQDNLKNYLEITGQVDEEGRKISTNSEANGRYHTQWLNMMYPRLRLARNLLSDDGVIFISIDDNEVHNLRKICDEVFGESNFIGLLPTVMNLKGNNDQFGFAGTHEYTIVYAKNIQNIEDLNGIPLSDDDIVDYEFEDEFGKFKQGATLMRTGEAGAKEKRPKGYYPIYVNKDLSEISVNRVNDNDYEVFPTTRDGKNMSWRRSKEYLMNSLSEIIVKNSSGNISFYKKQRLDEDMKKGKKAKSLFYKPEYSSGNGTSRIKDLFNDRVFDNPKPISLIKDFIFIGTNDGDIILDFFAGSGTTADAVILINHEMKANRKFILVQLPEPTDDKSEAYKAGYKNICEIGKERIRRAGDKILEENKDKEGIDNLDVGFKVFKLDSSNLKRWNPNFDELEDYFDHMTDNFVEGRTEEDVLYEIMLKFGIDLTYQVEITELNGKKIYSIGQGSLFICLDNDITLDVIEGIVRLKNDLNPEITRIVFKDNGFKDDSVKTNALQILEKNNIEEVMSI